MNRAGVVLGVIALALNFLFSLPIIALSVAVVGFSLSAIAIERAWKNGTVSLRVPIAGLTLNLVAIVISIYSFVIGLGWIAIGP